MGVFAQQTPPSRPRSGSSFTQIDDYLSVIKRLGIPTADSDVLDGLTSGPNTAKIVYNTTLNKLRVYNPVTAQWRDAIEADLTNYYTKSQVDSLLSGIDISKYVKVDDVTTGYGIHLNSENGGVQLSQFGMQLSYSGTDDINGIISLAPGYIYTSDSNEFGSSTFKVFPGGVQGYISGSVHGSSYMLGDKGFNFSEINTTENYYRNFGLKFNEIGSTNYNIFIPRNDKGVSVEPEKRTLPLSVNGLYADKSGNITIPPSSGNFIKIDTTTEGNFIKLESGGGDVNIDAYGTNGSAIDSYGTSRSYNIGYSGLGTVTQTMSTGELELFEATPLYIRGKSRYNNDSELNEYRFGFNGFYMIGLNSKFVFDIYSSDLTLKSPQTPVPVAAVMPLSVNGVQADFFGNITLPEYASKQDIADLTNLIFSSSMIFEIQRPGDLNTISWSTTDSVLYNGEQFYYRDYLETMPQIASYLSGESYTNRNINNFGQHTSSAKLSTYKIYHDRSIDSKVNYGLIYNGVFYSIEDIFGVTGVVKGSDKFYDIHCRVYGNISISGGYWNLNIERANGTTFILSIDNFSKLKFVAGTTDPAKKSMPGNNFLISGTKLLPVTGANYLYFKNQGNFN